MNNNNELELYNVKIDKDGYTEFELELIYEIENNKDFPIELLKKLALDYIYNAAVYRKEFVKVIEKYGKPIEK
jgi:hypothetical protein